MIIGRGVELHRRLDQDAGPATAGRTRSPRSDVRAAHGADVDDLVTVGRSRPDDGARRDRRPADHRRQRRPRRRPAASITRSPAAARSGIVGESGSGKTLICRSLLGLLPPGRRGQRRRIDALRRSRPDAAWTATRVAASARHRPRPPSSRTRRRTSTRRSASARSSPRSLRVRARARQEGRPRTGRSSCSRQLGLRRSRAVATASTRTSSRAGCCSASCSRSP